VRRRRPGESPQPVVDAGQSEADRLDRVSRLLLENQRQISCVALGVFDAAAYSNCNSTMRRVTTAKTRKAPNPTARAIVRRPALIGCDDLSCAMEAWLSMSGLRGLETLTGPERIENSDLMRAFYTM